MRRRCPRHGRGRASRRRGFILAYLMFALALAGIVTVGLSQIRSRDVQAEVLAANVERILSTITLIRGQLILCAATYPVGAVVPVEGGGTVTTEFPVLSGANASGMEARVGGLASDMQCPGRPASMPRNVWSGNDGVFFPPLPPGFAPWTYSVETGGNPLRVERITVALNSTSGEAGRSVLRRVRLRLLERGGQIGSTVQLSANEDTLTVVLLDSSL